MGGRSDKVVKSAQRGLCTVACSNDDLLERHGRRIACCEHTRQRSLASGVHDNFAMFRQLDRTFEPVGVGNQTNLDEHAFKFDMVRLARRAVLP